MADQLNHNIDEIDEIDVAKQFFADVADTRIEDYGNRSEVREIVYRLVKSRHPALKLGMDKIVALAQIAITTGASPLHGLGEIYVWEGGGLLCWQLGYKYYERRSQELGGIRWYEQPRFMTDTERKNWGVPANAAAAGIACGIGLKSHYELSKRHNQTVLRDSFGRTGIGVVDVSELTTRSNNRNYAPKGKTWQWVANKRARMEVLRALFPATTQIDEAIAATADAFKYEANPETIDELPAVDFMEAAAIEHALRPPLMQILEPTKTNSLFG